MEVTLETLASKVLQTLDAQQQYFAAAKLLQRGIGTLEEKNDLYKKSLAHEKELRTMAVSVVHDVKPQAETKQETLFK